MKIRLLEDIFFHEARTDTVSLAVVLGNTAP